MRMPPRQSSVVFFAVVSLIVIAQLLISVAAVSGKSPTADEPLHAYAGWRSLKYHDLRFNPEHPPLWKYWAALPSMGIDFGPADEPDYRKVTDDVVNQWLPTVHDLFRIDPAKGLELIWRGRCMMALLACGLTVAAALLGRELGGNLAGMIAAGVAGLDPNTLAHGPLVTNDVPIAMMFVLVPLLLARLCQKVTWGRVALLAALLSVAMGIKFTAILLGPATALCLLARAVFGGRWEREGRMIGSHVGVTLAILCGCGIVVFGSTWAMYGFREAVTSDGQRFSRHTLEGSLRWFQTHARTYPALPTRAELAAYRPGLMGGALLASDSAHLMPNAWTFGMTYAVARAGLRAGYLLGEHEERGWWYYFPVAMSLKTPTPSLLGLIGVAIAGCVYGRSWWRRLDERRRWALVCVAITVVVYSAQMLSSNLNIGFRHFFPAYYLLLIVMAVAVAHWVRTVPKARWVGAALGAGLVAGVAWSFPNYIPYFNLPSRLIGRPIDLLADSNLDWGQDLPLIAKWQREHPGVKLYLSYFGMCDPEAYGIRATPVYPAYEFGPEAQPITEKGVLVISASRAQGLYYPDTHERSHMLRQLPIREILGNSVLIYDVPLQTGITVRR